MAGKKPDRIKRTYRPLNETSGVRGFKRDGMNFSDVDRALNRWIRKNGNGKYDVPTTYIEYDD